MENKGKRNRYTCEKCGGHIITVNLTDGVTPFCIGCRANWPGECDGFAESEFYRIDQDTPASWGWYRPDEGQLALMDEGWRAHIEAGGLALRKLDSAERELYGHPPVRQG